MLNIFYGKLKKAMQANEARAKKSIFGVELSITQRTFNQTPTQNEEIWEFSIKGVENCSNFTLKTYIYINIYMYI